MCAGKICIAGMRVTHWKTCDKDRRQLEKKKKKSVIGVMIVSGLDFEVSESHRRHGKVFVGNRWCKI